MTWKGAGNRGSADPAPPGEKIFIDGHNTLGAFGIDVGEHRANRDELIRRVSAHTCRGRVFTIFFDGHPSHGQSAKSQRGGVRVVFARSGRPNAADEVIVAAVKRADRDGQAKSVLVVTNDSGLAQRAQALGARTSRVDEFFGPRSGGHADDDDDKGGVAPLGSDAGSLTDDEITKLEQEFLGRRRPPPTCGPRR